MTNEKAIETHRGSKHAVNPVLPVHAADPHLVLFNGRFYIYATDAGVYPDHDDFHAGRTPPSGGGFAAWSSADLVTWRPEGQVLKFIDVPWARGEDWAPAAIARNGLFYLYFCSASRIGVAVAASPAGPFHDPLGKPLIAFRDDLSAIDPMVFIDDDGQAYLHFGAVPASWLEGKGIHINMHLSAIRLNPDMVSLQGQEIATIPVRKRPDERWTNLHHIEAPFLLKRRQHYYLMWSAGACMCADEANAYRVCYATSPTPIGPWTIAETCVILSSSPKVGAMAPGHHSVLQLPGTDDWIIAYHVLTDEATKDRHVWLGTLHFDQHGAILPVEPSLLGPVVAELVVNLTVRPSAVGRDPFAVDLAVHLPDLAVDQIQYYNHGQLIGQTKSPSETLHWSNARAAFCRFTAIVLASGHIYYSSTVYIDIPLRDNHERPA